MGELAVQSDMTRDETLTLYRRMREAIPRLTSIAAGSCSSADMERSAKQLGLLVGGKILLDEEDSSMDMIGDLALFEPNRRGRRAYDRFLANQAARLGPEEGALAHRMSGAFFSVFRCVGPHERAGVWLRDRLDGDRSIWLMDESMEQNRPPEDADFSLRIFDAGPFHAGFGLASAPNPDTVELAIAACRRGIRSPFRHSLAAECYRQALEPPLSAEDIDDMIDVLANLLASRSGSRGRGPSPRKARDRLAY